MCKVRRRLSLFNKIAVALAATSILVPVAGRVSAQGLADSVVATVNGEKILYSDWVKRMEGLRTQDFIISITPLVAKNQTGGQISIESLINAKVVLQYAKKVDLMPSDKDISADFEEAKARADIKQALESKKFTEAEIKDDIRLQRAFYNVATVNVHMTPEEIRAYYDRHTELHGSPEKWNVKAIRVSGKIGLDVVQKALASGMAFDVAATQYSEDPLSKKVGGDIGIVPANDPNLPVNLRVALSSLKVGQVSAPVLLPGSTTDKPIYFLAKLIAKTEAQPVDFEKVKDKILRTALLEKANMGATKLIELRKDCAIVIMLPAYKDVFKPFDKPVAPGKD
ncbi:MAG: peptidyl-prolyl cis-trans isomerase [Chthonomonadales bacterium]